MMNYLKSAGIGTGLHYPVPLHLQKAYASLKYSQGDFPVSESAASEIISLPMFPQLTAQQQARVGREIIAFSAKASGTHPKSDESSLAPALRTA
jgi:dTDP-4-amino-4,6-dideoxygalactose transaminase